MNNRTIISFLIFSGLFFGQSFAAEAPATDLEAGADSIQCPKCSTTFQPPQIDESSKFKCPNPGCGEEFTCHVFVSELEKPFTTRCWDKIKRGCCTKRCAKRATTILVRCTIIVGATGLMYLALSHLPDLLPSAMAFMPFDKDMFIASQQVTLYNSTCPTDEAGKILYHALTLNDLHDLLNYYVKQCDAALVWPCRDAEEVNHQLIVRLLDHATSFFLHIP